MTTPATLSPRPRRFPWAAPALLALLLLLALGAATAQAANPSGEIVSADFYHTCALMPSGGVHCWGRNGDGQATDQPGPYTQVSAGGFHTCALTPGGAVHCWGLNSYGQAADQPGPYAQVSAGDTHTCALTPGGAVHCWGFDGAGPATDQPGPYTQVSAGANHTCALTPSGAADCWGDNTYGQAADQPGPYTQISAGGFHTCALAPGGAVHCWGDNTYGQAADQPGPYTQISAGRYHTCALTPSGAADCWGNNGAGRATDQPGPYTQISAGGFHTCALTPGGAADCWGYNSYGQATDQPGLYGPYTPDTTPPLITPDVAGTAGSNGWYTSDVTVTWTVSDAESAIGNQSGCGSTTLNADTTGTTLTCSATSAGGAASQSVTIQRDAAPPSLSPTVAPNPVLLGGSATASPNTSDATSGVASASCGVPTTSSVGSQTVACSATDNAGNTASATATYAVHYDFSGFFEPVDNLPTFNRVKAGRGIPVKFSLGGNQGLSVLAAGYPVSQQVACDNGAPVDDVEQTVTAGSSSLSYDGTTNQYTYTWKTDGAWGGTCRQLNVKLADGTEHKASFNFTR